MGNEFRAKQTVPMKIITLSMSSGLGSVPENAGHHFFISLDTGQKEGCVLQMSAVLIGTAALGFGWV